jgi:iron complex transport system substrate-binding protein
MHDGFIVSHRGTGAHREHRDTAVDALNVITGAVIAAGVRIHRKLGPGLLESVYEVILARDLTRLGFHVERQKPITFEFEGTTFESAFRPDLIINDTVIVEIKAAHAQDPVFQRQLLTYLKITNLRLGLVMNFGMETMMAGVRRIAH